MLDIPETCNTSYTAKKTIAVAAPHLWINTYG